MSLGALLDPKSVAIIGASENPDKVGGRPLVHLANSGFKGRVLPVNPTRQSVQGLPCYPAIADLPEVPEVAVIAVPGAAAEAAIAELAGAGTQVAVVMSSGFGEVSQAGKEAESRMRASAAATGMRIVGPNSMGTMNFSTGAVLTFTTALLEVPPIDGPVAIVSQSGSMAVEPYLLLAHEGIGVRQVHATGNDSDVSAAEMALLVASDPSVELLLLYFESVKDAGALVDLARRAQERDLAVIALKGGRTSAGMRAAQSHTGALASEDRVVDAFLERVGIWRARDLDDLVRSAALHLKRWKPRGRRVAVMSNSGASCVQTADASVEWNLELAELAPQTRAALDAALPSFATTANPIDLTAALIGNPRLFKSVLPPVVADPSVDAVHVALPIAGQGYDIDTLAADLADVARTHPVVVSCPMPEHVTGPFTAAGLPLFRTETAAIAALGSFLNASERRASSRERQSIPFRLRPAGGQGRSLDEAESLAWAAGAGVKVVEHRLCRSKEEAVTAFREFGAEAVALKGCSAKITHKSDLGLVRLGLATADGVAEAYDAVAAILGEHDQVAAGVLVTRMIEGRREMLVGAKHDPVFGPVVVIGDGGIYVEARPDIQLLIPPFTADDVLQVVDRLSIAPILHGTRGESAADLEGLARTVVGVGDHIHEIVSIDLNPVIVGTTGCVAVDAVVFVD